MPCDKDFGYVTPTRGLTWECYGDLLQLAYVTMSETMPEYHLIILCEFLAGNKTLAMSSSIRALVNCSRVWVNCLHATVKLHLSCTKLRYVKWWLECLVPAWCIEGTSDRLFQCPSVWMVESSKPANAALFAALFRKLWPANFSAGN